MPRIRILPDTLVSQIAAGEVVERPASVVKELVENALDAQATEVRVELETGGKRRIAVRDDGSGMGRDDALLAFDRHATSKIGSFGDLQAVPTLGFRGEALASIAAVARIELLTAEEAGEGWRVRIEGGRVLAAEPAPRPVGTTVEVRSLFFNVPARRKFLKRTETELRRCVEVLQGYALVRPEVRLELRHDGRLLLDALPGERSAEGRRERIRQIFGAELARDLVPLPGPEGGDESIDGFVGRPSTARGRRSFVFVNGRLLRDRMLLAAFYRAVRETWRSEEFPSLFLFLELPPRSLDVNVHPQKAEVRFRDLSVVDRVRASLEEGLRRARGEAEAPLRSLSAGSPAPPRGWEGPREQRPAGTPPGEVREPRLAEVSYRPATPSAVPLSGPEGARRSLRLLGQYKGALVLLEGPDGLLLVDQHAAHERILYERLARALAADRPQRQRLLVPRLLELSAAEALRLRELAPHLDALGFGLEALSGNDLALTALPAVLGDEEAVELLSGVAMGVEGEPEDARALGRQVLETYAAERACKGAIKIHQPLDGRQMEELVSDLFACEEPYACPHGRPTVLKMTDADLERRFGRR